MTPSPAVDIVRLSESRSLMKEFIHYPKRLYSETREWVPWFDSDMKKILSRKHPFFEHSEGDFFLALRGDIVTGRICLVENNRYNEQHGTRSAHFYFFDADDDDVSGPALLSQAARWAADRRLEMIRGPMLFGGAAGSGILIKGYEYPAAMTMMPYNFPYYRDIIEKSGFTKHVDLYSMEVPPESLRVPEKVAKIADIAIKRGRFQVLMFKNKKDILRVADEIANLYNATLGDLLEDYPLSDKELDQVKQDLLVIADPKLIKILKYDDKIVGYLFSFPDLSAAMRKNRGKLHPFAIWRLLRMMKKSKKVFFNGMGILPEFQRLGGNALLYRELEKSVHSRGFREAEVVQISELTELMLRDIKTLGGDIIKIHRLYEKRW